jgi:excisionase family DNA binding protein
MPEQERELLTSTEVATLLRVHPKHIYRLLRRGLPARRLSGKWLFERAAVLQWAEKNATGTVEAEPIQASLPMSQAPVSIESHGNPGLSGFGIPPLLSANGDLAVELLLGCLTAARHPPLGFVRSDRQTGLELMREGQVLASGWHGEEPPPVLPGHRLVRLSLVRREVGLVSRTAQRLPNLEDLQFLRLASRPTTAGIRAYLDHALKDAGLDSTLAHGSATLFSSHCDVVCAVARDEADVGIATRAWAQRLGLSFRPLGWERYQLLLQARTLGEVHAANLCETAQSSAFKRALERVHGYDPAGVGELRFDT